VQVLQVVRFKFCQDLYLWTFLLNYVRKIIDVCYLIEYIKYKKYSFLDFCINFLNVILILKLVKLKKLK